MPEETVTLFNNDWYVKFDFDLTATHTERVGHIGMKETVMDDWDITLLKINDAPIEMFSPKFVAMVIDAIENETDFIQEQAEAHSMDWHSAEIDRAYDEKMDRMLEAI